MICFYIINLQNQLTSPSDMAHDLSKPPLRFVTTNSCLILELHEKISTKLSLKTEKSPKYLPGESQVKMVANSSVSSNTLEFG